MSRRAWGAAIGVCLGLVALSVPASAWAVKSWKVGGLLYSSRTVKVAPGEEGSGYIGPSPDSRQIVSGGVAVSGPPGQVRVNGVVSDGSNNAWFAFVDVFGSRERSFRSFSIRSKGTFTHVEQDYFPIAPGQIGSGTSACSAGQAVGGGEAPPVGYGDSRVIESSSSSPTSWNFAWRNTDDVSHSFDTHVTCKEGWDLRRRTATRRLDPGDSAGAKASCRRREHVVGGGAAVISNDLAYLTASRPLDGRDAGKAPDDAWRAAFHSASATQARIEALAICRRQ